MPNNDQDLKDIIKLMKHMLAVQLYKSGATQDIIAKQLHIAKAEVVKMVKGVKKYEA